MNLKDLVSKVSSETSLPASEVRKVTVAVLDSLRANVELGENFTSPQLTVRAATTKPSEKVDENGVKIAVPERKVGRLVPKASEVKS